MTDYSTKLCFAFPCRKVDALNFLLALDCLIYLPAAQPGPDGLVPVPPELISSCPPVDDASHLPDAYRHWASLLNCFDDPEDLDIGIMARFDDKLAQLWICDDGGSPNIDAVAALIQRLLPAALPVGFEWSHDCTQRHTDAYGGGWCLITQDKIHC